MKQLRTGLRQGKNPYKLQGDSRIQHARHYFNTLLESGMPYKDALRAYVTELLEIVKTLHISDPDIGPEFARLVEHSFRETTGMPPPPLRINDPVKKIVEDAVKYMTDNAEKLRETMGLQAETEAELQDEISTLVLEVFKKAAETVLEWYAPKDY